MSPQFIYKSVFCLYFSGIKSIFSPLIHILSTLIQATAGRILGEPRCKYCHQYRVGAMWGKCGHGHYVEWTRTKTRCPSLHFQVAWIPPSSHFYRAWNKFYTWWAVDSSCSALFCLGSAWILLLKFCKLILGSVCPYQCCWTINSKSMSSLNMKVWSIHR